MKKSTEQLLKEGQSLRAECDQSRAVLSAMLMRDRTLFDRVEKTTIRLLEPVWKTDYNLAFAIITLVSVGVIEHGMASLEADGEAAQ